MSQATMRPLSIRQPFAEQIMTGEKSIEYRTRRTKILERVYIYATKGRADDEDFEDAGLDPDTLNYGCLIGTVDVTACTGEDGDFEWHLANPKRLPTPLQVTGMPQPGFFWPFGKPEDK